MCDVCLVSCVLSVLYDVLCVLECSTYTHALVLL